MMDANPQLKWIFAMATGVNNIDIDAARDHGIHVYNCQDYGSAAVAQHTMMLLLALATRGCIGGSRVARRDEISLWILTR